MTSELRDNQAYELYQRARDLADAGQIEQAVFLLEESSRLSPHFKTLEILGELLLKLSRPSAAIVPLAAASTLNGQVRAPSLLAEALLRHGDRHKAAEIAELVLAVDPNNHKARLVLEQATVETDQD